MDESNQNYIYGFPKVTQVIFVKPNLEALIVRIPRTFFIDHPSHRSIQYEGLNFEVYRIKENTENHSTICTGILKYHPPKTLKQLKDLNTVLTYFAKRDQRIIRLIKDIFSKQLHRMAMQVQTTSLPLVDLTADKGQHPKLTLSSSGRQHLPSGFHPYVRSNRAEGISSHHSTYINLAPKPNQTSTSIQSTPSTQNTFNSEILSLQNQPNKISTNIGSYGHGLQQNFGKQSEQLLSKQIQQLDSSSDMINGPNMYANNFKDHLKLPPVQHPTAINNLRSDVQFIQTNVFRNPSQTQIGSTTSEIIDSSRAYHNHLNQQHFPLQGQAQSVPPSLTNGLSNFQQNEYGTPGQLIQYQPQIQNPSQRLFTQSTYLPLNDQVMMPHVDQPNGINQTNFANDCSFQNQNASQNIQLLSNNISYLSTPLQINSRPQNYVPIATVSHYPSISFQDNVLIERNQCHIGPSSNYHVGTNFFSPPQPGNRYDNLCHIQSQQNIYPRCNLVQWSSTTLTPNMDMQNSPISTTPQNTHQHHQEQDNWHTTQKETSQLPPQTQDFNNHTKLIPQRNPISTVSEPVIQESSRDKPALFKMATNNQANVNFFTNSHKSNIPESICANHTNEVGSGTSKIGRPQNISQSSSASVKSNLKQVLNILDNYVKTITKEKESQNLGAQKSDGVTRCERSYLNPVVVKDEPTEHEEQGESKEEPHNSLGYRNQQNISEVQGGKADGEITLPLITVEDDDLDDDIFEIINTNSCEIINSPSSSSGSSQCLVIDENASVL